MSLLSMTGFGRGAAASRGMSIEVELSSVNRKQLDLVVQLPRNLLPLEARVHEELRNRLHRGRISGTVNLCDTRRAEKRLIVDQELAAAYAAAFRRLAGQLHMNDQLDASLLLQWPGVVKSGGSEIDTDLIWPCLRKALRQAVSALVGMRGREGAALQQDLEKRLAVLRKECTRIEQRAPAVALRYRKTLAARLRSAGLPVNLDDERLLRELALFADRSDISEELTRLLSHFKQVERNFGSRGPSGRALDFLAQEMFREINTIGSKANDAAIAHAVVRFKAELERIREQVQNIE